MDQSQFRGVGARQAAEGPRTVVVRLELPPNLFPWSFVAIV